MLEAVQIVKTSKQTKEQPNNHNTATREGEKEMQQTRRAQQINTQIHLKTITCNGFRSNSLPLVAAWLDSLPSPISLRPKQSHAQLANPTTYPRPWTSPVPALEHSVKKDVFFPSDDIACGVVKVRHFPIARLFSYFLCSSSSCVKETTNNNKAVAAHSFSIF